MRTPQTIETRMLFPLILTARSAKKSCTGMTVNPSRIEYHPSTVLSAAGGPLLRPAYSPKIRSGQTCQSRIRMPEGSQPTCCLSAPP